MKISEISRKKFILLFILGCISFHLFSQVTEIIYLSGRDAASTVEWDFYCTDGRNSGKWTKIPVPSNWELKGFGNYNYGHDWKDKSKVVGKEHGLYKHQFMLPFSSKGKTVNIVFDGGMTDTKVKINGEVAGATHQGAFTRFSYDITKLLKYGDMNLLEVEVSKHSENESVNKAERQADFWIFGGIYRPVFLEVLPATHISRAAIDAKGDGSCKAYITLNESKDDYSISMELYDLEGKAIGNPIKSELDKGATNIWLSGNFGQVEAWNPEKPVLYNLSISLSNGKRVLHQVNQKVGFRTVELRPHDGIYVNNKRVIFKGVNRHSFWPETGRCLSEENHLTDIRLMKEMNMNAVRMSHYVPDKRFLELCDSIGLFVLDEVTGWHDAYDTIVGPKLIKEIVLKDENHPCVVIWDHGNEGGWDFANEKWLNYWDIQNRPVICPWLLHNGIDTHHYPDYKYALQRFISGNDPFMPTELLHGLYDGGHGAGLEDYWSNYEKSPLHAGGFLWVFVDEAVLRTDKEGTVFDGDGNHAPDGILGPHREKEGSFYTIKEIWSPVQVKPVIISPRWDGQLFLENKYIYTNLNTCSFSWKAFHSDVGSVNYTELGSGILASPDALPGEVVSVKVDALEALNNADVFIFTAKDQHGIELYSWSWPVIQADKKAKEWLDEKVVQNSEIQINESENSVSASLNSLVITFNKKKGNLENVKNSSGLISLSGGQPTGQNSEVLDTQWKINEDGEFEFNVKYDNSPKQLKWILTKKGLLSLKAEQFKGSDLDFIGISFSYPEEYCTGIKWMGRGPYRVWKNRSKGSNIGIWEKPYNNTVTGESFNNLIYPEFKGYHSNLYWAVIENSESSFTVVTETPNLYFQLFTPESPEHVAGGTNPPFPDGDLSFLYEIPAIGTKFKKPSSLGPNSQKGSFGNRPQDDGYPIKLWFDFTVSE